jgi:dinuclear metal center YbgI/SA1388 family protein
MNLQVIAQAIEAFAPRELQESYDNAGLQCGDPRMEVSRVLTCLDITEDVIEEAHQRGCQMVVSHHPLLFHGVKVINPQTDYISRILMSAIRYGIGIYSAHTNLDKAEGGINHRLAQFLDLKEVRPMSECGVFGNLPCPMSARELILYIKDKLTQAGADDASACHLRYNREALGEDKIQSIALCGGSGSDFIEEAESLGVGAYLTGEMHYHSWFGHPNLLIIEAGHFETEQIAPGLLADIITSACPGVECLTTKHLNSPTYFL